MLIAHGDWMDLGSADEQKPVKDSTVEAWGRSESNPVGGWGQPYASDRRIQVAGCRIVVRPVARSVWGESFPPVVQRRCGERCCGVHDRVNDCLDGRRWLFARSAVKERHCAHAKA